MAATPTLWRDLRRFTPARVALGRAGNGVPTAAHLAFQAAHAAARDAVHAPLDTAALTAELTAAGFGSQTVHSAAPDRRTYLLRPDLGRKLAPDQTLTPLPGCLALVICDGLSALAVQRHAAGLLQHLRPLLTGWTLAPIAVAEQGRVALADEIGAVLQADAVAVLIGERPGLSAADSLGVYLTWQPRPGRTDAERNCISNIRPGGLALEDAAKKLAWLIREMRTLKLTGIGLKDQESRALPRLAFQLSREGQPEPLPASPGPARGQAP
jgi:ethanolamine ammonia-lyase small subunit